MTVFSRNYLIVCEVIAVLVLTVAVIVAALVPVGREALTWVMVGALITAFAAQVIRCGIGLVTYAVLIIVVTPAVSFWGFLVRGDGGMMASTTSLVRAAFSQVSLSFLAMYVIAFVVSMLQQVSSARFDRHIVGAATDRGGNITGLENWVFSLVALAAAYIYQPSMPGLGYQEVQYNLVAGHAWNYVCLTAYILILPAPRKTFLTWLAIVGVPVWLVLHFDRADILGLIVLWLLVARARDISRGQSEWYRGRAGAAMILGAALVLVFAYIGAIRNVGFVWQEEVFLDTVRTMVNYPTVQAVNHAFAAAVEHVARLGPASVISDYPVRIIPSFFVEHPIPAELVVQQGIGTVFGMHLAGEFYLQFGAAGAIVAAVAVVSFMAFSYAVMKSVFGPTGIWGWYAVTILMIVRIGWYGLFYYVKVMALVLPALLLMRAVVVYVSSKGIKPGSMAA